MSTTVTYKGETLTTVENATKKLLTAGKYCEDDITLEDVSGGGTVIFNDLTIINNVVSSPAAQAWIYLYNYFIDENNVLCCTLDHVAGAGGQKTFKIPSCRNLSDTDLVTYYNGVVFRYNKNISPTVTGDYRQADLAETLSGNVKYLLLQLPNNDNPKTITFS